MSRNTDVFVAKTSHFHIFVTFLILLSAISRVSGQAISRVSGQVVGQCNPDLLCRTCNLTGTDQYCTSCPIGYGLTSDPQPKCQACPQQCTQCKIGSPCQNCAPQYGPMTSSPYGCTHCIPNCIWCMTNVSYCDTCNSGYYLYANKTCGPCALNCQTYRCPINGAGKCDRCDLGYGLTPTNTCEPCASNCNAGCDKSGPGKCDQCDKGYGQTVNLTCAPCDPFCNSTVGCNVSGTCFQCNRGFGLTIDNTCGACDPNCNLAVGCNTSGTCILCNRGYGLTVNTNTCGHCIPNCIGCMTNVSYCDTCDSGYYLYANRTCGLSSIKIAPTYGPMAGGTAITIDASWTLPNTSISAVYFGSNLKTSNITSANNIASEVIVISPPIRDISLINKPLLLTLQVSPDLVNVSSGNFFTYKPNPAISDVSPRTIPLSGGIRLTATGSNLASASDPVIRSSVIIVRNNGLPSRNDSYGPCYQPNENGTQMICLSPPVYIPQDFLLYLFGQTDQYSDVNRQRKRRDVLTVDWMIGHETPLTLRSRFKRSLSIYTNQTYSLPNTGDTMQVFMYAIFDGFEVPLDNIRNFQVLNPPNISCGVNTYYDPKDGATITITGNGMSQSCGKFDYTVRIGNGFCNVTDLTDNELKCEPPKEKPQQTEKDRLFCGENFVVFIYVGNKTYGCSCLTYADNSKTTLIIIIVATVGSVLVISIVVVVISIFVKRSRTQKKPPTQEDSIWNPLSDGRGVMMMTSRQTDDIGDPESYETGGTGLSTEGYLNRIPGQDYITSPPNQSDGYQYQNQIDTGYVRPIEDD